MSPIKTIKILLLTVAALLLNPLPSFGASGSETLMREYEDVKDFSSEQLLNRAEHLISVGQMDAAQVCLHIIAGRYSTSMSQKEKNVCAVAFNKNAYIYLLKQNYIRAYSLLLKSLSTGDKEGLPTSYLYLSIIYYYYKDNVQERCYLRKAYNAVRHVANPSLTQLIFLNFANGYYAADSLSRIRTDLRWYRSLPRLNTPMGRYVALSVQGYTASLDGRHREAIGLFSKAIQAVTGVRGEERCLADGFYNVSKEYTLLGDYPPAIYNMQRCRLIASTNGYAEIETDCYRILSDYYRVSGDMSSYMACKLRYVEMKDSIFSESNFGRIKDMQSAYETEQIENTVNELTHQRGLFMILLALTGGLVLMAAVFTVALITRNRRLKAANEMLFQRYRQLEQHEEKEEEREPDAKEAVKTRALGNEVKQFFATSDEWCTPGFSLADLARILDSNTTYVSTAINVTFNKNFRTLLNEHRIRRASNMLSDFKSYGNITIEAIARDCGFRTTSHFSSIFKSITGLSPAVFREIARTKQAEER